MSRALQGAVATLVLGLAALGCGADTTLLAPTAGRGGAAASGTGPGGTSAGGQDDAGSGGLGAGGAQGGADASGGTGGGGGSVPAPAVAWAKGFGDELLNYASGATAVGTDIVVTGAFRNQIDFGGGLLVGTGLYEGFLTRFDAQGQHLWSRALLSQGDNAAPADVAPDGQGGVVVAGLYSGTLEAGGGPLPATPNFDHYSVFLARYNATGQHLWSQSLISAALSSFLGGNGPVHLVPLPSGVAVVASVGGTWDVGLGPIVTASKRDLIVIRFDLQGQAQWQRHFPAGDVQSHVARGPAGNIVVGGYFTEKLILDDKTLEASPQRAFVLALHPGTGATQWVRSFDGTVGGMAQTDTGDIVTVGSFVGTTDLGGGPLSAPGLSPRGFVGRFDAAGGHVSSQVVASTTQYHSAVADAQGRIILCGHTPERLRITVFDAMGQPQSDQQFSTDPGLDVFGRCAEHPSGVILFGYYEGAFALTSPPLPPSPLDRDIFFGRYDIP